MENFNIKDREGNLLYLTNKTVHLKLKNKRFAFKLGILHKQDNKWSLYKEEKEKGRYMAFDAWSIPYALLERLDGTLNFRTEKGIYRISVEDAKKHGNFLHFKVTGIERKIYIPISFWDFE